MKKIKEEKSSLLTLILEALPKREKLKWHQKTVIDKPEDLGYYYGEGMRLKGYQEALDDIRQRIEEVLK